MPDETIGRILALVLAIPLVAYLRILSYAAAYVLDAGRRIKQTPGGGSVVGIVGAIGAGIANVAVDKTNDSVGIVAGGLVAGVLLLAAPL